MFLKMQEDISANYKSMSQKIRVMSEYWLKNNGYCVSCGAVLEQHENNKPVGDFYCLSCEEEYELKSKKGASNKISDGAYNTMIEKIQKNDIPNFFCLNYKNNFEISNLIIIPKHYFTEEIIEKRNPLKSTARRAGWVGCNINLNPIPESGRIYLVKNSKIEDKKEVLKKFNKTIFLRKNNEADFKGWTLDIMKCIELLKKKEFSSNELYAFQEMLYLKHPENNNIKAKIRQQLQILRDNNYIEFLGKGSYRLK